jgi:hypothetical protein
MAALEEERGTRTSLVTVVSTDHTLLGDRIIGLAKPREQHQVHVVDSIGTQQHQIGRLFEFLAGQNVGVSDPRHTLTIGSFHHLGDPGMGAQLEIRIAHRDRNHRNMGAPLGVGFATKTAAISAVLAGTVFRSVGISIGARRIRGRPWERVIAIFVSGLGKQLA